MNLKSKSDKRNYIIIVLCLILVVMGVGYAAFSSLLNINGTASITNSWCVGFDNTLTSSYTTKTGITGGTAPTGSISFSGSTCETKYQPDASLTASFKQPGDQVEYTLTIKNKSTVPVAIKSILVENNSVTTDTTIKKGNIEFIVHMPESTNLAVDAETTMKVVARFQNTTDVTGEYNGEEQSINVKINAEQGTGTDGMTTTYTGTVYRNNSESWINNSTNITDLTEGNDYTKEASTINSNYYLKHDIVEDVVTNSYVCFVSDIEHCMKGADSGVSFESNTQIMKEYQAFYNLNTVSNVSPSNPGCKYISTTSMCIGGGLLRITNENTGIVDVYSSSSKYCKVFANGSSRCY